MKQVYLHTGTNQGDRLKNLQVVNYLIEQCIGKIEKISAIYQTAAWGVEEQNDFLNQALLVKTTLLPQEVLTKIHEIEQQMGRIRQQKWGARVIDIDILFYEKEIISTENLIIPHQHLTARNFVLIPLSEIAADWVHPILKLSVATLQKQCKDPLAVKIFIE